MEIVVVKFGGTSVGSIERIKNVAKKIIELKKTHKVVAVISAMSGETNRLTDLINQTGEKVYSRELDMILSSGEQVSTALLANTINNMSNKAQSLLGFQVKIHTDSYHSKARILDIEDKKINALLEQEITPIIAGFQGVFGEEITTLGRGGTDTSAIAMAIALKAKECLIYTDVDGVYSADPRLVKRAQKIDVMNFEEMLEFASAGSKVLHPRSVNLAGIYKMPIRVLSSMQEGNPFKMGTIVKNIQDLNMEKSVVTGITSDKNEAKLTIYNIPDEPGIAGEILSSINDSNINLDMIVQTVSTKNLTNMSFTVPKSDFKQAMSILEEFTKKYFDSKFQGSMDIVKISMIGIGMKSHSGVAAKMFKVLGDKNVNIQLISTSEIKISIIIDEDYAELAMRNLHTSFGLDSNIDQNLI